MQAWGHECAGSTCPRTRSPLGYHVPGGVRNTIAAPRLIMSPAERAAPTTRRTPDRSPASDQRQGQRCASARAARDFLRVGRRVAARQAGTTPDAGGEEHGAEHQDRRRWRLVGILQAEEERAAGDAVVHRVRDHRRPQRAAPDPRAPRSRMPISIKPMKPTRSMCRNGEESAADHQRREQPDGPSQGRQGKAAEEDLLAERRRQRHGDRHRDRVHAEDRVQHPLLGVEVLHQGLRQHLARRPGDERDDGLVRGGHRDGDAGRASRRRGGTRGTGEAKLAANARTNAAGRAMASASVIHRPVTMPCCWAASADGEHSSEERDVGGERRSRSQLRFRRHEPRPIPRRVGQFTRNAPCVEDRRGLRSSERWLTTNTFPPDG